MRLNIMKRGLKEGKTKADSLSQKIPNSTNGVKLVGPKTHIVTAAQGVQNPYSARHYGRDSSKGRPNDSLISNLEAYTQANKGDLKICAVAGSYVNEVELDGFFQERDDVRMDKDAFLRLQAQRDLELSRRDKWDERDEEGRAVCDYPMHYFWDEVSPKSYPVTDERLNSKISLMGLPEPTQNKDPLSGNTDLAQQRRGTSIIFPHTKQRLKAVPKDLGWRMPRLILTTGSCTLPNYNRSNRRGRKADRDHEQGFLVVDVLNDDLYLPRLVPAQKDGTFIDMGIKYSEKYGISKAKTSALILGDLHVPRHDRIVMEANHEMMDFFKPAELYIHDLFDGISVSPHTLDDEITRMLQAEEGSDILEHELQQCYEVLVDLSHRMGNRKIKVVASNHDDFFRRWLAKGAYRNDYRNARFAHKVLSKLQKGDWPLKVAIEQINKIPKNVEFLTLTSDCRPWGYECGAHGHLGINGSKGSLRSLSTSYGKVIIGHVHQLEVMNGSISVGTSGVIPMPYQEGQPSTSMAGNAVIYEGGLAQALPIIYGKWKKK